VVYKRVCALNVFNLDGGIGDLSEPPLPHRETFSRLLRGERACAGSASVENFFVMGILMGGEG